MAYFPISEQSCWEFADRLARGRLETEEQFGNIVIQASPNGSFVRIRDVRRVELGSQTYSEVSSLMENLLRLLPFTSCPAPTQSTRQRVSGN